MNRKAELQLSYILLMVFVCPGSDAALYLFASISLLYVLRGKFRCMIWAVLFVGLFCHCLQAAEGLLEVYILG